MQKTHLAIIILLLVNLVFTILLFTRKPQGVVSTTGEVVDSTSVQTTSFKNVQTLDGIDYVIEASDRQAADPMTRFNAEIKRTGMNNHLGVAYKLSDVLDYLNNGRLASIMKRHREHAIANGADTSNYEWGIAYAWKYGKAANSKVGMGFYVLPVWINKTTGEVLNYFDRNENNDKYYYHPEVDTDANNLYDEGHLFP
ncbi:MAG: hypothetical protein EOP49_38380 [Sphingobacteriales bacterium]|nr:MAG: hypothetical protein EOP49_38380 [Sphingobacteriales bacterium]